MFEWLIGELSKSSVSPFLFCLIRCLVGLVQMVWSGLGLGLMGWLFTF